MKITITKNEIIEKFNLPIGAELEIVGIQKEKELPKEELFVITDGAITKTSEIIAQMKALFPIWISNSYENIDEQFPIPTESTTRHFLKGEEPDSDTLELSVNEFE